MEYDRHQKQKERLTGYEEQEILISMLSESIGKIVGMSAETLKLSVKQGLQDALDKRNANFKDMKIKTQDEKTEFVHDLVINTVKRAKLVESVDIIVTQCDKTYDDWKRRYRPEEITK